MEPNDKYFIVTRVKSRKGFARGSIGKVEAETKVGEIFGLVYGNSSGTTKSGGLLRREDTYPLTRHQAQLLLYVSPASRRLEILCNQTLFRAICELTQDDLVVVRHKKGFQPCLVRNLMQIGRKDGSDDLNMLGFELQAVNAEQKISSKKQAPLPVFSAADIIQVAPRTFQSNSRSPLRDNHTFGANRKPVSRINSMPTMRSRLGFLGRKTPEDDTPSISTMSDIHLEVGSMVEVTSDQDVVLYGVIRWIGTPTGKSGDWAGVELDEEVGTCTDGTFNSQRYFTCKGNRALFVPLDLCVPDRRFHTPSPTDSTGKSPLTPAAIPVEENEEDEQDVPPLTEAQVLSVLEGKMRGIQGHFNSCYLDATLFSLFSASTTLDRLCQSPADMEEGSICRQLKRDIVCRLRRNGFVPAENVMNFRKKLGCDTFVTEEKDPEEFLTILLKDVLRIQPLLKIRSNGESGTSQDTYTYQIILEKNEVGPCPSVQQLLETSFNSCGLKFEEVPSCLMVQMPRFGKNFKMFPCILPTTELDITDLLHQSPRECCICGQLALHECAQCFRDRKIHPGRIKQYCSTCNTQVHSHPSRQGHTPCSLPFLTELSTELPLARTQMHLFAVLCIKTSHYVSFVKYGPGPRSWMFFDSMADRCGDDHTGYNIPEVQACPEVGDFLSQSEDELAHVDLSQVAGPVRRLLCDSFMCLYQMAR